MQQYSTNILDHVGNTPLIELPRITPNPHVRIMAKLEGYNPTGSIKDRVVKYMIDEAESSGILKPPQTIIEASTGNTALALSLIAKQKGYTLKVVMLRRSTPGISDLLKTFGVDILWCEPTAGMKGAIEMADVLGKEHSWFNTKQFESQANIKAHYDTTAPEILQSVSQVDVLVAGIGTGGTLMGTGKRLMEHNPKVQLIGVEPKMGEQLQGLRSLDDGYVPPLLDLDLLSGRFIVDTREAFKSARDCLEKEGLFVGVSSGAVLNAAQRVANRMDSGTIVVIFADSGWKYLTAGPWKDEMENRMLDPDNTAWW